MYMYVKSRKQDNIGVSPLKSNGQLVNDSKGKADILINQFKSVFTREENKTLPKTTKHISTKCRSIPDLEIPSEGIEKLLKNINPSKASGPNRILKECAKQLAPGLTSIYQKYIDTGTLPRDGYSCETLHDFMKSYDVGLQTDVAILDFSKAFDTVPHNKLLHKLDDYGVRGSINRWLEMFLTQRKMKVVINGDESEEATVDPGVPQGTVLTALSSSFATLMTYQIQ